MSPWNACRLLPANGVKESKMATTTINERPGQQDGIVSRVQLALADPEAPWYGSDLVSLVGDMIENTKRRDRELASALILLAAEMVRGKGMPSDQWDDWKLPPRTPTTALRQIMDVSRAAQKQSGDWGRALRLVVDRLRESD